LTRPPNACQAKRAALRAQRQVKELEECTFSPKLYRPRSSHKRDSESGARTAGGSTGSKNEAVVVVRGLGRYLEVNTSTTSAVFVCLCVDIESGRFNRLYLGK
jgi:hypothetical protein